MSTMMCSMENQTAMENRYGAILATHNLATECRMDEMMSANPCNAMTDMPACYTEVDICFANEGLTCK